jgi:hypothetical protein
MPEQRGQFGPLLVAAGMIGAVGGSLMNLVYPYFLVSKGWRGPQFRRVQTYDFLLAMAVMLILDLAIWTLGAETLNNNGGTIATMDDLPWLLGTLLGRAGELLFYAGIFAAVFTSLVGHALGLGLLANHAWLRCQSTSTDLRKTDFRGGSLYRAVAAWCLISPLVWTLPGMPDFVALTLVVNAMQVVLLPLIAGGLWVLSSRARDIGDKHINRWWEHVVLGSLLTLAIWGAWGAITSTLTTVRTWGDDSPTPSQLAAGTALSQVSSAAIETSEEGHTITADFHGHPLSQQDLTRLRELDHLEQLDLSGTRITDADLRYLQGLGHLRKLTLLDLALSRPAIERLQRSLPACRIVTTTSGREP